ncbi:MAG: phosphate ABC transporter substrate-binding protein [Nitrospirota bacterium]
MFLAVALVLAVFSAGAYAGNVDTAIPAYQKVSGVSGSLNAVGSDTMNNLMALWCEGFARFYPSVRCQIEGKGSSTAPPALIEATAQIGPMSRQMKSSEVDAFQKKFGYKPTQVATSLDALAVYVNKDNPVKGLTIEQLDAIFSKTRKCGARKRVETWGDLGLTGDWKNHPISLYGRNSASGTYAFFKEHALCKGDYRDEVKEQPGSASVVQGVTEDRYGIGYSGIGYITSGVRTVPLAKKGSTSFMEPSAENLLSGRYPLGRFLYVYINRPPNRPLDPLVREFVSFILSREGQQLVVKSGYQPLPASVVKKMRKKVL